MTRRPYVSDRIAPLSDALVERVKAGYPVVYPTTTQPALGCLPTPKALDRLFETKGREMGAKVSLGVANLEQAESLVQVHTNVKHLLASFPQGSLTLILPAKKTLDERLGGDAVAVRVLVDGRARALLNTVGPLTATSANRSGEVPSKETLDAARALSLDDDHCIPATCPGGLPITLIRCDDYAALSFGQELEVLREGVVSKQEVLAWSKKRN